MGTFRFYTVTLMEHHEIIECFRKMFPDEPGHFLVSDNDVASRSHLGTVAEQLDLTDTQMLDMMAYDSSGAAYRTDPLLYMDPAEIARRQKANPAGVIFGPDKPVLYTGLCDIDRWQERHPQLEHEFRMKLKVNIARFKRYRERFDARPKGSLFYVPIQGWRMDERVEWDHAMSEIVGDITDGIAVAGAPHQKAVPIDTEASERLRLQRQLEYVVYSSLLPRYLGHSRIHVFARMGKKMLPLLVHIAHRAYEHVSSDSTTIDAHDVPNKLYYHPEGRYGHKRIQLGRRYVTSPDFDPPSDAYPQCDCEFCLLTYGITERLAGLSKDDQDWLTRRFQTNVYELAKANAKQSHPDPEFIRLLTVHNIVFMRREVAMLQELVKDRDAFHEFLEEHKLSQTLKAVKLVDKILRHDKSLDGFLRRARQWEQSIGMAPAVAPAVVAPAIVRGDDSGVAMTRLVVIQGTAGSGKSTLERNLRLRYCGKLGTDKYQINSDGVGFFGKAAKRDGHALKYSGGDTLKEGKPLDTLLSMKLSMKVKVIVYEKYTVGLSTLRRWSKHFKIVPVFLFIDPKIAAERWFNRKVTFNRGVQSIEECRAACKRNRANLSKKFEDCKRTYDDAYKIDASDHEEALRKLIRIVGEKPGHDHKYVIAT